MRKRNLSSIIFGFILSIIVGLALFVYISPTFEREAPVIKLNVSSGYWNLKDPIDIVIEDESQIKEYRIFVKTPSEEIELDVMKSTELKNIVPLQIKAPVSLFKLKEESVELIIEAQDSSKWNYFEGNRVKSIYKIIIDKKRPIVTIVTNSYSITKGGSSLVIFKAEDENIDEIYVEVDGKKFKPQPFYKDGYYISLVAWSMLQDSFKAMVVASDKAGNISKTYVPYYLIDKSYSISKIELSDAFLDGKIAELSEVYEETQGISDKLKRFKLINEDVRVKNEKLIHEITSRVSTNRVDDFPIKPFYPLRNGAKVASFGDHRLYSYGGNGVSESYHMGLDLASVKLGDIKTQNPAVVVYTGENGIYGQMPILHHGLGLYTLYGHCSSLNVNQDDLLKADSVIANTGMSGYAMGDHLHFGVLVQGVEVRPEEWMDTQWLNLNINDVIKNSKKIIDGDKPTTGV